MDNNKWLILGLDLGVASVGWALISEQWEEKIFIDAGVKIFQEPVEAKSRAPKNFARREARGARRNLKRKVARKIALKNTLLRAGLVFQENFHKNIYELRTKALSEKLELDELFAVLYHFWQKRGFLSNAKNRSSDDGAVKSSILSIEQNMEKIWARTLGEYRFLLMKHREENNLPPQKFEEKYTSRSMYKKELEMIWEAQKNFHKNILAKELEKEIFYYIFYQRPLKIQKNLVGNCSYFKNRKRAEKSSLIAQEFLVYKQISDLKYKTKWTWNFVEIWIENKKKLAEILMNQWSYSFAKAKKLFWLPDDVIFNFENAKKEQFAGNAVLPNIIKFFADEKNFDEYRKFEFWDYENFLQDLRTILSDEYLINRLKNFWKISEKWLEEAMKMRIKLPNWHMHYSEKAMKKILKMMKENFENDRQIIEILQKKWEFPEEINPYQNINPWTELPVLRNPSVTKSIVEARKVIKAVSKNYGMPTLIRIEMASDLKNSKNERLNKLKKQKENEKENEEARKMIAESNQTATRERQILYRLWKECEGICPYTGKSIDLPRLIMWDSGFDVEHIIPYSRSLDDSFANKTLCDADFNRNIKKNKTPFEIGQENPDLYRNIMARVNNHLPYNKRKKFELQTVSTDDFISRQLNDTRYICREVRDFCESLVGKNNVEITKWRLTGLLRKAWNFNNFIKKDDIPGENGEWAKKDRSDHRHHMIDAVVVALTGRNLLQKVSIQSRNNELKAKEWDERMENILRIYKNFIPNQKFLSDLQDKIDNVIISHTAVHKIKESLHEDTAWGKIYHQETKKEVFVTKKSVESLNAKSLENIVDKEVREILKKYFVENKKFDTKNPPLHKDGKTPILKARIYDNKANMYDYRGENNKFFVYGNNHHVEILEHKTLKNKDGTPKREWVFVTMFEANRRAKNREQIVNRIGPWKNEIKDKIFNNSEWNFVFSLCNNDLVKYFPNPENTENFEICRVQKMLTTRSIISLTSHLEALTDKFFDVGVGWFWKIQKIQIDALGNIFPSND